MTSRIHGSFSAITFTRPETAGFLEPSSTTAASSVASTQSVRACLLGSFLRVKLEYGLVVDVVGPSRAFQANPQHQGVKLDY
jgi:hypothetical protein